MRKEEILQLLAFGIWRLSKGRNDVVFDNKPLDPIELVGCLILQVNEYRDAQLKVKPLVSQLPRPLEILALPRLLWHKPSHGMIKVDCDGAWVAHTKSSGTGCVFHNDCGKLLRAGVTRLPC